MNTATPLAPVAAWSRGTDLREDGIYCWPHKNLPSETRTYYPAVSTILSLIEGTSMRFAEFWFIAEYAAFVAEAAERGEEIECFDDASKTFLMRPALSVLKDKNWMKGAGSREMRRRANRGTVLHDAFEDFTLRNIRVSVDDTRDYTQMLINKNGFELPVDFCLPKVALLLPWCSRHICETHMSEAVVMHDDHVWAGTLDWKGRLMGIKSIPEEDTVAGDVKSSEKPHQANALQLAGAYNHAQYVGIKGTALREPWEPAKRTCTINVTKDGVQLREWENGEAAYAAFLQLRAVWQWHEADEKAKLVRVPKIPVPTVPTQPDLLTQLTASVEALKLEKGDTSL